MFYHVLITLADGFYKHSWQKLLFKKDIKDESFLRERFVDPYHFGEQILTDGMTIPSEGIEKMQIFKSSDDSAVLLNAERRRLDASIDKVYFRNDAITSITTQNNVTDEFIVFAKGSKTRHTETEAPPESSLSAPRKPKPSKVFIVHGHDDSLIHEVKAFLSAQNIEGIVLREQTHASMTIIEKLESCIDDPLVGFCLVLYTPDDEGRLYSPESENPKKMQRRARQNVVFEHGLLMGKLGRNKVTTLVKSERGVKIELPGDISGVVYTGHSDKDWRISVAHMLNDARFDIDYRKIS